MIVTLLMTEIEAPVCVLVVDDDRDIQTLVAESLSARGYHVLCASNAVEMDRQLARNTVDLIILDIMMPGEDGLSICRRMGAPGNPPIIVMSAMGDESDRIVGLEMGADHYLTKPCSPRELLANVRAVVRRSRLSGSRAEELHRSFLGFAGWKVDLITRELTNPDNVLINLSDGEFALLRAFVQRPRRVLTREQLLEAARGPDSDSFDRAIDVQVSRLRRKLQMPDQEMIRTVRNEGYMFTPRVMRL